MSATETIICKDVIPTHIWRLRTEANSLGIKVSIQTITKRSKRYHLIIFTGNLMPIKHKLNNIRG